MMREVLGFVGDRFLELVNLFLEVFDAAVVGQKTFLLTHVAPSVLHVRDCTFVDGADVGMKGI